MPAAALPPLPHLFDGLAQARGLVLAVSGGPDSTALLHLAARWRPEGLSIRVACVDHGLRPEARREAETVVAAATSLDLPAEILTWAGEKPKSRLQEWAREARYALLFDHARQVGASHVVTAHTLDDQAETLLMRMAAGSGPRGLAGMRPLVTHGTLQLARPLLSIRKAALVALCQERGWAFVEDPSNADPRFARVRWRRIATSLASEGLTAERLGVLAARMSRLETALDSVVTRTARACRIEARAEEWQLAGTLFEEPDEIVLRVLDMIFSEQAPLAAPRLNKLEVLLTALREARLAGKPIRRTLQGCIVSLNSKGILTIGVEPPRRAAWSLLNATR